MIYLSNIEFLGLGSYKMLLRVVLVLHYLRNMVTLFFMFNIVVYTSRYVWSAFVEGGPNSVRPQYQAKYTCSTDLSRYWNVLFVCIWPHNMAAPVHDVGLSSYNAIIQLNIARAAYSSIVELRKCGGTWTSSSHSVTAIVHLI